MKRFLQISLLAGALLVSGEAAELKFDGAAPSEMWQILPRVTVEQVTEGRPATRFTGELGFGAFELPLNTPEGEPAAGATGKLTLALWLKLPEEPADGFLFVHRSYGGGFGGTPGYYQFSLHPRLGLRFVTGKQQPVSTRRQLFSLEPGVWTHLAMVYDQGVVTFYRNGERLPVYGETGGTEIAALEPIDGKSKLRFLVGAPSGISVAEVVVLPDNALDEAGIRALSEGVQ